MKSFRILTALCFVCAAFVPSISFAETGGGQSLSVTPTLFQMSAVPSQAWSSGVKVVNNNPYDLTVYAQVVNFAPQGEAGEGKFLPVLEEATEGTTLAEWITISSEPFTIAPEKSVTIPFSVAVPENAAPGGHFAAILVGTKPPVPDGAVKVTTAQIVTSLFFVRIAGDVTEEGQIREFTTTKSFVDSPHADFEVRFENKGNVHLQPQGEIVITNMWGKERGVIPINHQTHFGNVLPNSIRKFEFTWKGEQSFSDIGRYKAVLTLAYGSENRKFETSIHYFYVVPLKATAVVVLFLIVLFAFIRWSVNAYIRRMLMLSGIDPYEQNARIRQRGFEREGDVRIVRRASVQAPLRLGILDFKERLKGTLVFVDKIKTIASFVLEYKTFFAGALITVLLFGGAATFITDARTEQRDYEVVIDNPDTAVTLSSEDILYAKEEPVAAPEESNLITAQDYTLIVVNSSDTPGAAAKLKPKLEAFGYRVDDLQSDFTETKQRSVIVFPPDFDEKALDLSKRIGGALLSAITATSSESVITIYIGNDLATSAE